MTDRSEFLGRGRDVGRIERMRRPPPGGYFGRALIVDLGTGASRVVPLEEPVLRGFIGGAGLGTWLMHRYCPAGVEPLAPEAPLMFVFSPLVGTPLTTSAKFAVVAKSPLTGRLTDALASSHFAIAGKLTGHDAIVLRGACSGPSVLMVDGSSAWMVPADDLWGLPAAEAERELRERMGPAWRVAAIGPAGERVVRYATISHDGRHAGRGGLGAVMGSKWCKAIMVRAGAKVASADPAAVLAAAKDLRERSFGAATAKYREMGTMANLLAFNAISALPTRRRLTERRLWGRRRSPSCVRLRAARARRARSGASISTRVRAARRPGWSTRTCSRWGRCAESVTPIR
jgi:aldehyde:ferredoxin oxidoreductase